MAQESMNQEKARQRWLWVPGLRHSRVCVLTASAMSPEACVFDHLANKDQTEGQGPTGTASSGSEWCSASGYLSSPFPVKEPPTRRKIMRKYVTGHPAPWM